MPLGPNENIDAGLPNWADTGSSSQINIFTEDLLFLSYTLKSSLFDVKKQKQKQTRPVGITTHKGSGEHGRLETELLFQIDFKSSCTQVQQCLLKNLL